MATIEERALKALEDWDYDIFYHSSVCSEDSFKDGYVQGAMEQKAIDDDKALGAYCKSCRYGLAGSKVCKFHPCAEFEKFRAEIESENK